MLTENLPPNSGHPFFANVLTQNPKSHGATSTSTALPVKAFGVCLAF
jgi:hypothetical protein